MVAEHECYNPDPKPLRCAEPGCDKWIPERVDSIRFLGKFTGPASTSDAVQEFWETGDPAPFDRQRERARGAREERRTRVDRVRDD